MAVRVHVNCIRNFFAKINVNRVFGEGGTYVISTVEITLQVCLRARDVITRMSIFLPLLPALWRFPPKILLQRVWNRVFPIKLDGLRNEWTQYCHYYKVAILCRGRWGWMWSRRVSRLWRFLWMVASSVIEQESCCKKTTLFRCGQDPRLHRQGCKYVCTTCGGLWGEVMMMMENNVDASREYVDFIKTDPHMFAQVEGCTNLPELKTHDVEDLD